MKPIKQSTRNTIVQVILSGVLLRAVTIKCRPVKHNPIERASYALLFLSLLSLPSLSYAVGGFLNNFSFTTGHVAAVAVEKNEAGEPILAEFDSNGSIVNELPAFTGRGDLTVMPAQRYRTFVSLATQFRSENPGSRLMSVEQYRSGHFKTNTTPPVNISQPALNSSAARSVLITDERNLFVANPPYTSMVLQEFPVDVSDSGVSQVEPSRVALLIDTNGRVVYQSDYDISYKVGIFKDNADGSRSSLPISPVAQALVYSGVIKGGSSSLGGGFGVTDDEGKYLVHVMIPPCPGFSYSAGVPINVEVPVSNFNPKATESYGVIPISRVNEKFCSGYSAIPGTDLVSQMAQLETLSIEAALDTNTYDFNMWMSSMLLNVIGTMPGIERSDELTQYSSQDNTTALNLHQGLLKNISTKDLQNTDIYIYRTATGQLIAQLDGLVDRDDNAIVLSGADNDSPLIYKGVHTDNAEATFGFSSLLVGAASFDLFTQFAGRRHPWSPSESGAANFDRNTPPNFLRPGEEVTIIAINRATGYIGSQNHRLQEIFNIPLAPLQMYPPNLKIIATRTYEDDKGLSKDQLHKDQLIGSEGAGLTSDQYIKIQTIWLANDGSVLPDNLPGYTGRLAISNGSVTVPDSSDNFEIKPGYNTEVIKLNNKNELITEHFYVQVVGEPISGNPSFASPGAGSGKLQTRPANYVPVKVPVFDEAATQNAQQALRNARAAGQQNLPAKVEPVYRWVYRPEMQFSVYDLKVRDIKLEGGENNNFDFSIINLTNPVIGADSIVDVFLTLNSPDNDPLAFFGPGQDLILKIGAKEYSIQQNQNGEQHFIEIDTDHFNDLTVDDFLTISVFLNHDAANTLWQFGFSTLDIDVDSDNNNGLGMPDRSPEEELIDTNIAQTGKVLKPNTGDEDNDGIPNFADFDAGAGFVPMVIEIPEGTDINKAKLKLTYEESLPDGVVVTTQSSSTNYEPAEGILRIWNKNGNKARQTNDINSGGNYVISNRSYPLNIFTITNNTIVLYLESVRVDNNEDGIPITVDLDKGV